jgi:hypothetical protein
VNGHTSGVHHANPVPSKFVADPLDEDALDTLKTERSSRQGSEPPELPPTLVKVICADDLNEPPARHWLEGCEEVRIFRGRPGSIREEPHSLAIVLDDRYASVRHVLLRRGADGFLVADEGSTNGTYVEGRKLAAGEERLVQAALFEVGHTFFHLRAAARGAREAPGDEGMGDPLTWNPEFALTLAAAGRLARRAHDLLLTGESGVGKEVVARWLHHVSERQGALVAVNCAATGIFFDLTGAATSHAISGDPPGRIATPLVLLLIAAASWALRPPSRTLKSDSTLPKSAGVVVSPEDVAAHA